MFGDSDAMLCQVVGKDFPKGDIDRDPKEMRE